MKKSTYKSYDELPLFLNAEMVANVLGVSSTVCYEMMHAGKLPVIRIGNRLIVPKEKVLEWITTFPNHKTIQRIVDFCNAYIGAYKLISLLKV